MKKIFILAGELSGDKNGAWYLKKLLKKDSNINCQAFGGDFLQSAGAKIYQRIETLNLSGFIEILKHLPRVLKCLNKVTDYIIQNNFDEVILVDFPGFNLRLARKLKQKNKNINITYLAPPQTWAWGKGRIKILKKCFNKVVVLYPFEVDWYKKHGLKVEFLENPTYDQVSKYFGEISKLKSPFVMSPAEAFSRKATTEKIVLLLPGSREHEINSLLPIFVDVAKRMQRRWRDINFTMPLSEPVDSKLIEKNLRKLNFGKVQIVQDKEEKFEVMSKACLAISKPGTITLELALFNVPTIVAYKVSWITYLLGRLLADIKYMSLPNLLLDKELFKEFIQKDCNSADIFEHASNLYQCFLDSDSSYFDLRKDFERLKGLFRA